MYELKIVYKVLHIIQHFNFYYHYSPPSSQGHPPDTQRQRSPCRRGSQTDCAVACGSGRSGSSARVPRTVPQTLHGWVAAMPSGLRGRKPVMNNQCHCCRCCIQVMFKFMEH